MDIKPWKKRKRSGGIKRKLSKQYSKYKTCENNQNFDQLGPSTSVSMPCQEFSEESDSTNSGNGSVFLKNIVSIPNDNPPENCSDLPYFSQRQERVLVFNEGSRYSNITENNEIHTPSFYRSSDSDTDEDAEESKFSNDILFREQIRKWAIEKNIAQAALKDLSKIINSRFPNTLPNDPRTLLRTPRSISIVEIQLDGEYWHNGLTDSLQICLEKWVNVPDIINLNINFDGLPIYKSSKKEFWPILCNILEDLILEPFVIGIYCGIGKPKSLEKYLEKFVTEMKYLLDNGIYLSNCNKTVTIRIRCFVCDSPARAYIKGVCNFNGKHGCLKCNTVGEYSHNSHTVYFPQVTSSARTNDGFRVADCLHLIDLGVMKRLLIGWRDGNLGKFVTKWCSRNIDVVMIFLLKCKLPSEIHRSVRGIDCLVHWKASEYRSFLFYLSIIILPDVLPRDAFVHFLFLYCAITICSSKEYLHFLPLAKELLQYFVQHYKDFYGVDYITSNVHNLLHVVEEVERYGPLQTFSAYPFENKLYLIKKMLRGGKKPLPQVAKRLSENFEKLGDDLKTKNQYKGPFIKKTYNKHTKIYFQYFCLSKKPQDKYFMTHTNDIFELKEVKEENLTINGYLITGLREVFDHPVKSSNFNIFKAKMPENERIEVTVKLENVKLKLVCIEHKKELYFIPLIHTV
ncbi:hypothetical protein evm_010229 [Chilo suppressalis]|nr:hypothetical protein evm_014195 [Chilo suppressalis]RVE45120.1 hypothetical protein evm_010229 [Chilo suppressalis]